MGQRALKWQAILLACAMSCTAMTTAGAQSIDRGRQGQEDGVELNRELMRNDIGIELLGKAVLYSFFFQHTPSRQIGLEIGLGALGGGTLDDNATVVFIPIGGKLYLVPKDGSLYLAAGGVIVTAGTDSGPFDESTSYAYAGLGFEFRAESGLLFRGTAYGLIAEGGFFIWPGLSVGYAF